jgi:hypothetical protein
MIPIPKALKHLVWDKGVLRRVARRGWRPPGEIPLDDMFLNERIGVDHEDEIKQAISKVRENAMVSFERLASLWQQVVYLDRYHIPGSFVECGVWKGGSVGMMALAHLRSHLNPTRVLHLFDSFQGLPEPKADVDGMAAVAYSGNRGSGWMSPVGQCVGTLEENRQLLEQKIGYPDHLINYHVGWFQDTLPREAQSVGDLALLRLDGDWYESTKVCLEHLYHSVVKGGVIVIDDYGHWEGCRRAVDEFLEELPEPILLHHVDYTARCWVKPW